MGLRKMLQHATHFQPNQKNTDDDYVDAYRPEGDFCEDGWRCSNQRTNGHNHKVQLSQNRAFTRVLADDESWRFRH